MGDIAKFRVPYESAVSEFTEKRSRFISHLFPVKTEEEALARIREVKSKYHDARHNCWCYLLGRNTVRYSDDGEPQGTAGQPMLKVFEHENVTDVCCVVTRYFGGILLGTGGLTPGLFQRCQGCADSCRRRYYGALEPAGNSLHLSAFRTS